MKTDRLFSGDHHLPYSLLFTTLALLILAYKFSGFPQDPGYLLIFASVIVLMILYIGLVLHRGEWLIAPLIGIAATLISILYSQTIYATTVCESTMISQGYPYPWIRHSTLPPSARCIFYHGPSGSVLSGYSLAPNPLLGYIWFLADVVFYTLLTLAILEFGAAARRFRLNLGQEARSRKLPTATVGEIVKAVND